MGDFKRIEKVCSFYISSIHLITMILPYLNKQLKINNTFITFLEYNFNEIIKNILLNISSNEENKQNIFNIGWNNKVCKYNIVEKNLKEILKNTKRVSIIVSGNEKYINNMNNLLNKFVEKNPKKIQYIKIINCYEVSEFNNNVKEILDNHDYILNTSGEHKVEEVFEGYSKKQVIG